MEDLVSVLWLLTGGGGALMYVMWLRHGGTRVDEPRRGVSNGLAAPHASLLLAGLVFWVIAVAVDEDDPLAGLRWLALGALALGIPYGIKMFLGWRSRDDKGADPDGAVPASVVYLHGLLAVVTTVAAVVAAVNL